ncbi:hypothetical protein HFX_6111 (plasmid) [Haloferax mediterranei ATCC 33500]|uniref:Uncharacterized protein n=1 Tax=Haloferax mediterranei (strain ATCC 33500 / DSM 1411 / JCM 8866 / NBRC 14739 / NCIMB 2177 / R-4) TaxID=523841 RepID=I3RAH5_HALMT|nr:hypothetical protein HFX_6111 [Haloferax mediterranei ATCC 33500]
MAAFGDVLTKGLRIDVDLGGKVSCNTCDRRFSPNDREANATICVVVCVHKRRHENERVRNEDVEQQLHGRRLAVFDVREAGFSRDREVVDGAFAFEELFEPSHIARKLAQFNQPVTDSADLIARVDRHGRTGFDSGLQWVELPVIPDEHPGRIAHGVPFAGAAQELPEYTRV